MDIQDQSRPVTPSGYESHEVHICNRCRWPFPNPHPICKHRRAHNRICGTIEGYAKLIIDSEADSDDEHHSDSDHEEKGKTPTHESHEVHICLRCGWPFPNPHPSSKHLRAHKRICGTIEGYTKLIIDSEAVSDDEHHSDSDAVEEEKTPSPKIENKIIKESGSSAGRIEEKSNRSEDDMFSDAVTEFSDTGISPGVSSEVKKIDENSEVFESPITHSKDADKIEEHDLNAQQIKLPDSDTKHSVPLVEDSERSHKDQGEDVHELSLANDIPLVDKAETLIEDFKDHKTMYSNVSRDDKHGENRSVVDNFEVKNFHESQTSEHEDSAFVPTDVIEEPKVAETQPLEMRKTVPESTDSLSEAKVSHDKPPVMTLGKMIEAEIKKAETARSVPVSTEVCTQETVKEPKTGIEGSDPKDSVNVGTSESLVGEGSGKLLTSQDYGVDATISSSSQNSLEGNWGSVSGISDDRSRFGRSDAFEGPSLVESDQEIKLQKGQPSTSEAIAKVTNWSTTPLRNMITEARSSSPKQPSNVVQKDDDAEKASERGNSNMTRETPEVNQESSSLDDGKIVKKKTKGITSWVRFLCCSMPMRR